MHQGFHENRRAGSSSFRAFDGRPCDLCTTVNRHYSWPGRWSRRYLFGTRLKSTMVLRCGRFRAIPGQAVPAMACFAAASPCAAGVSASPTLRSWRSISGNDAPQRQKLDLACQVAALQKGHFTAAGSFFNKLLNQLSRREGHLENLLAAPDLQFVSLLLFE